MQPRTLMAIATGIFAGTLGFTVVGAQQEATAKNEGSSFEAKRVQIGYKYARQQGIHLNIGKRDRDLVGLGSYLVNAVGGCNDCHTAPPYTQDPYAFLGAPKQINIPCYLAGGQQVGPEVSRDITPWEDGKPAGLSLKEFVHVIRTGEDPDNPGHVLEVMPWPVFQSMSNHDLHAIYDYLSSIPAIPANTCGVPSEEEEE